MVEFEEIMAALKRGDASAAAEFIRAAVHRGPAPRQVLENWLQSGIRVVRDKMSSGEIFIPDLVEAVDLLERGAELLRPMIADSQTADPAKVVIGTVEGDLHELGKNLVAMVLRGVGLDVVDLGADVSTRRFLSAVETHTGGLLCLSSFLTTSMMGMRETVEALEAEGLRDQVKVMVGGAPVTQAFADEIGADAYATDAAAASQKAVRLLC